MTAESSRKRVGLALGAGSARGCAHIGVLRAIEEHGIPIDFVAGTSIGSLVGGVYASGKLSELEETMLRLDWKDILYNFFELSIPRSGLIDGKRIVEFISQFIEDQDIRDLSVPFRAVATDIVSGDEVVLEQGRLMEVIRASISVPGIFTPVQMGRHVLVDGGLVNPVPVSVARAMGADVVIAVDINADRLAPPPETIDSAPDRHDGEPVSEWRQRLSAAINERLGGIDQKVKAQLNRWTRSESGPNIFDVLGNTVRIMEAQIAETMLRATQPDVLIRPTVGHITFLEFHEAREAIREGYRAAMPALEGLRERLHRGD